MTELSDAAERLMRAVDRLELAYRRRAEAHAAEEGEREPLETLADDVRHRLDNAIERLRVALES